MPFWKSTQDDVEDDKVIDLDERLAPYDIDLDAAPEPEAPAPRRRRRLVAKR
jgi:hypothetical protein